MVGITMIKSRKMHRIRQQLATSLLAAILFIGFIASSSSIAAFGHEYTASGHPVGMIPDKPEVVSGEEGQASILADNMIMGDVVGIEATFGIARIQEYDPVTHSKVSEFSVPCPSGSCNGRGIAFDGTNFWYSILSGGDVEELPIYSLFLGDGLIHKIGMTGGADITTISDGYGAGGRGIGAIDIHPVTGNLWVSSYLPVNSAGMLDETCITDDTGCLIEIRELTTTGTLASRCDVPYENGDTSGIGNESLVVEAASGTFLTDGGEADLMFLDRYLLPTTITAAGTLCTHVADFDSPPVGIGGIDFDFAGNLVATSTFGPGISNLDGSPFDTLVGSTFSTDADIEDITIKRPPPGKIIIIKDTLPDNPQDFRFTGDLGTFTLDDDTNPTRSNMMTFSNRDPGTYRVTETEVSAFPLRAIRCVDPSGDTTTNLGSATANIKLAAGETVTCTFVNGEFPPPCVGGSVATIQPVDPISMNTIVGKSDGKTIAKTIHVEKQIFDCETSDGVPLIADVTIMAEIFEDMNTRTVIHKQVEVITCLKQEAPAQFRECSLSIPDLDAVVVKNCREDPISNPQEMNTVTKGNGNGIIKTIEAQKEVFLCNLDNIGPDEKKVDLVLFTEIWENLVSLDSTPTDPTVLKTYLSMRCVIKIETVTVEACAFTQPKQIFP